MKKSDFEDMLNDKITIRKPDGREFPDVPAVVDAGNGKIIHLDVNIPVEVGDQVTRETPAGVVERFVVEDPGLIAGGKLGVYEMKVKRVK